MADTSTTGRGSKGSPNDFLKAVIGTRVVVRLVSGIDYRGTLTGLDGHMNIALEETTEWSDGAQKAFYGDAFVRGNNGMSFTTSVLHLPFMHRTGPYNHASVLF